MKAIYALAPVMIVFTGAVLRLCYSTFKEELLQEVFVEPEELWSLRSGRSRIAAIAY
jgi:hypothetical protein